MDKAGGTACHSMVPFSPSRRPVVQLIDQVVLQWMGSKCQGWGWVLTAAHPKLFDLRFCFLPPSALFPHSLQYCVPQATTKQQDSLCSCFLIVWAHIWEGSEHYCVLRPELYFVSQCTAEPLLIQARAIGTDLPSNITDSDSCLAIWTSPFARAFVGTRGNGQL